MLRAELADQPYVKADFNREVQAATGRSHGAVEYKFQNISAVLRDLGLPYVVGYRPLPNLQNALRTEVERLCGGSRRAASWASECAVPTRARAALDPGFASVAAAGQVGAAGPVPACAEPVHPGAVQRWLVASRGGLALVSGRSIMTDAPRWYVQLRLLIDGRGEVSIGRYLFDAQHVEPRRARPADSRGIAPGGRT
jgi:hypothetical protein